MFIQNQENRKDRNYNTFHGQTEWQWKRASKNLHNYIQCQNIQTKTYQFNFDHRRYYQNKEDLLKNKSINSYENEKRKESSQYILETNRSIGSYQNLIKKHKSLQRISINKKIQPHFKDQQIQTVQIQGFKKNRNYIQENNCMKELIKVFQNQILDYSRKIYELQHKIQEFNLQNSELNNKLSISTEESNTMSTKLNKEKQMNNYLEEIIGELNIKITQILSQNRQLNQRLDEFQSNYSKSEKISQIFSQDNSALSINSASSPVKQKVNPFCKSTDNIIECLQSNILMQQQQNSSFRAFQMSFNKTPNKVHQTSINEQNQKFSFQMSDSKYDEQIEQFLKQHKDQMNHLKQKVKYLQIQNSMLRRKNFLFQKNTEQINDLKQRIQKLSQQKKLIKLIQQKKSVQRMASKQNHKQHFKTPQTQTSENREIQDQQKLIQKKQKVLSPLKLNQHNNLQKRQSKRKNFIQRKFSRKQIKSPTKLFNKQEDHEFSFQLSPERA